VDITPKQKLDIELNCLFLQHGYCDVELWILDVCWMHLHALWLSDIWTGTGNVIAPFAWTGDSICKLAYHWPRTVQPSEGECCSWQQANATSLSLNHWRQLLHPLGDWFLEEGEPTGWYFEGTSAWLWQVRSGEWAFYGSIPKQSCTMEFEDHLNLTSQCPSLSSLWQAMVVKTGARWKLTGHSPKVHRICSPKAGLTVLTALVHQMAWTDSSGRLFETATD